MRLWSYNNKRANNTVEKLFDILVLVEIRDELDLELKESDKRVNYEDNYREDDAFAMKILMYVHTGVPINQSLAGKKD